MSATAPSERTQVHRLPQRGAYDRDTIHAILDEGLLAHVGLATAEQPFVLPMVYGRIDDTLYLHGSSASRLLRAGAAGHALCATVTLVDGLVVARSAFHHSMNFRSVVVLGDGRPVDDAEERLAALRAIVNHVVPERWLDSRRPNAKELAQTLVLALSLKEASAKVRTGPPVDDAEDLALPYWAGTLPVRTRFGAPETDAQLPADIEAPTYLIRYERPTQE